MESRTQRNEEFESAQIAKNLIIEIFQIFMQNKGKINQWQILMQRISPLMVDLIDYFQYMGSVDSIVQKDGNQSASINNFFSTQLMTDTKTPPSEEIKGPQVTTPKGSRYFPSFNRFSLMKGSGQSRNSQMNDGVSHGQTPKVQQDMSVIKEQHEYMVDLNKFTYFINRVLAPYLIELQETAKPGGKLAQLLETAIRVVSHINSEIRESYQYKEQSIVEKKDGKKMQTMTARQKPNKRFSKKSIYFPSNEKKSSFKPIIDLLNETFTHVRQIFIANTLNITQTKLLLQKLIGQFMMKMDMECSKDGLGTIEMSSYISHQEKLKIGKLIQFASDMLGYVQDTQNDFKKLKIFLNAARSVMKMIWIQHVEPVIDLLKMQSTPKTQVKPDMEASLEESKGEVRMTSNVELCQVLFCRVFEWARGCCESVHNYLTCSIDAIIDEDDDDGDIEQVDPFMQTGPFNKAEPSEKEESPSFDKDQSLEVDAQVIKSNNQDPVDNIYEHSFEEQKEGEAVDDLKLDTSSSDEHQSRNSSFNIKKPPLYKKSKPTSKPNSSRSGNSGVKDVRRGSSQKPPQPNILPPKLSYQISKESSCDIDLYSNFRPPIDSKINRNIRLFSNQLDPQTISSCQLKPISHYMAELTVDQPTLADQINKSSLQASPFDQVRSNSDKLKSNQDSEQLSNKVNIANYSTQQQPQHKSMSMGVKPNRFGLKYGRESDFDQDADEPVAQPRKLSMGGASISDNEESKQQSRDISKSRSIKNYLQEKMSSFVRSSIVKQEQQDYVVDEPEIEGTESSLQTEMDQRIKQILCLIKVIGEIWEHVYTDMGDKDLPPSLTEAVGKAIALLGHPAWLIQLLREQPSIMKVQKEGEHESKLTVQSPNSPNFDFLSESSEGEREMITGSDILDNSPFNPYEEFLTRESKLSNPNEVHVPRPELSSQDKKDVLNNCFSLIGSLVFHQSNCAHLLHKQDPERTSKTHLNLIKQDRDEESQIKSIWAYQLLLNIIDLSQSPLMIKKSLETLIEITVHNYQYNCVVFFLKSGFEKLAKLFYRLMLPQIEIDQINQYIQNFVQKQVTPTASDGRRAINAMRFSSEISKVEQDPRLIQGSFMDLCLIEVELFYVEKKVKKVVEMKEESPTKAQRQEDKTLIKLQPVPRTVSQAPTGPTGMKHTGPPSKYEMWTPSDNQPSIKDIDPDLLSHGSLPITKENLKVGRMKSAPVEHDDSQLMELIQLSDKLGTFCTVVLNDVELFEMPEIYSSLLFNYSSKIKDKYLQFILKRSIDIILDKNHRVTDQRYKAVYSKEIALTSVRYFNIYVKSLQQVQASNKAKGSLLTPDCNAKTQSKGGQLVSLLYQNVIHLINHNLLLRKVVVNPTEYALKVSVTEMAHPNSPKKNHSDDVQRGMKLIEMKNLSRLLETNHSMFDQLLVCLYHSDKQLSEIHGTDSPLYLTYLEEFLQILLIFINILRAALKKSEHHQLIKTIGDALMRSQHLQRFSVFFYASLFSPEYNDDARQLKLIYLETDGVLTDIILKLISSRNKDYAIQYYFILALLCQDLPQTKQQINIDINKLYHLLEFNTLSPQYQKTIISCTIELSTSSTDLSTFKLQSKLFVENMLTYEDRKVLGKVMKDLDECVSPFFQRIDEDCAYYAQSISQNIGQGNIEISYDAGEATESADLLRSNLITLLFLFAFSYRPMTNKEEFLPILTGFFTKNNHNKEILVNLQISDFLLEVYSQVSNLSSSIVLSQQGENALKRIQICVRKLIFSSLYYGSTIEDETSFFKNIQKRKMKQVKESKFRPLDTISSQKSTQRSGQQLDTDFMHEILNALNLGQFPCYVDFKETPQSFAFSSYIASGAARESIRNEVFLGPDISFIPPAKVGFTISMWMRIKKIYENMCIMRILDWEGHVLLDIELNLKRDYPEHSFENRLKQNLEASISQFNSPNKGHASPVKNFNFNDSDEDSPNDPLCMSTFSQQFNMKEDPRITQILKISQPQGLEPSVKKEMNPSIFNVNEVFLFTVTQLKNQINVYMNQELIMEQKDAYYPYFAFKECPLFFQLQSVDRVITRVNLIKGAMDQISVAKVYQMGEVYQGDYGKEFKQMYKDGVSVAEHSVWQSFPKVHGGKQKGVEEVFKDGPAMLKLMPVSQDKKSHKHSQSQVLDGSTQLEEMKGGSQNDTVGPDIVFDQQLKLSVNIFNPPDIVKDHDTQFIKVNPTQQANGRPPKQYKPIPRLMLRSTNKPKQEVKQDEDDTPPPTSEIGCINIELATSDNEFHKEYLYKIRDEMPPITLKMYNPFKNFLVKPQTFSLILSQLSGSENDENRIIMLQLMASVMNRNQAFMEMFNDMNGFIIFDSIIKDIIHTCKITFSMVEQIMNILSNQSHKGIDLWLNVKDRDIGLQQEQSDFNETFADNLMNKLDMSVSEFILDYDEMAKIMDPELKVYTSKIPLFDSDRLGFLDMIVDLVSRRQQYITNVDPDEELVRLNFLNTSNCTLILLSHYLKCKPNFNYFLSRFGVSKIFSLMRKPIDYVLDSFKGQPVGLNQRVLKTQTKEMVTAALFLFESVQEHLLSDMAYFMQVFTFLNGLMDEFDTSQTGTIKGMQSARADKFSFQQMNEIGLYKTLDLLLCGVLQCMTFHTYIQAPSQSERSSSMYVKIVSKFDLMNFMLGFIKNDCGLFFTKIAVIKYMNVLFHHYPWMKPNFIQRKKGVYVLVHHLCNYSLKQIESIFHSKTTVMSERVNTNSGMDDFQLMRDDNSPGQGKSMFHQRQKLKGKLQGIRTQSDVSHLKNDDLKGSHIEQYQAPQNDAGTMIMVENCAFYTQEAIMQLCIGSITKKEDILLSPKLLGSKFCEKFELILSQSVYQDQFNELSEMGKKQSQSRMLQMMNTEFLEVLFQLLGLNEREAVKSNQLLDHFFQIMTQNPGVTQKILRETNIYLWTYELVLNLEKNHTIQQQAKVQNAQPQLGNKMGHANYISQPLQAAKPTKPHVQDGMNTMESFSQTIDVIQMNDLIDNEFVNEMQEVEEVKEQVIEQEDIAPCAPERKSFKLLPKKSRKLLYKILTQISLHDFYQKPKMSKFVMLIKKVPSIDYFQIKLTKKILELIIQKPKITEGQINLLKNLENFILEIDSIMSFNASIILRFIKTIERLITCNEKSLIVAVRTAISNTPLKQHRDQLMCRLIQTSNSFNDKIYESIVCLRLSEAYNIKMFKDTQSNIYLLKLCLFNSNTAIQAESFKALMYCAHSKVDNQKILAKFLKKFPQALSYFVEKKYYKLALMEDERIGPFTKGGSEKKQAQGKKEMEISSTGNTNSGSSKQAQNEEAKTPQARQDKLVGGTEMHILFQEFQAYIYSSESSKQFTKLKKDIEKTIKKADDQLQKSFIKQQQVRSGLRQKLFQASINEKKEVKRVVDQIEKQWITTYRTKST